MNATADVHTLDDSQDLSGLSAAVTSFVAAHRADDLDEVAHHLARRCVLDGLAVMLGGSEQPGMAPLEAWLRRFGGAPDSRLIGLSDLRLPPHLAALWAGTAGHAMDWDDTQLAEGPGRPYGLLMHPTVPPLAACLSLLDFIAAERGRPVTGVEFVTAFTAGFEVGCKIAEAINPDHYMRGFHTSGTIGSFAAAAAAAKLLDLSEAETGRAIGLSASLTGGIRAGFGTMTKPLHVGRAAENGVMAALLSRAGLSANPEALDGKWGYLAIAGPGGEPSLVRERFGRPFSMVSPGVSIKPYPSGVLTHPSMDALMFLMREEGVSSGDIEAIELHAGKNVLGPIRFAVARTELEGKFSFGFLLAAIALAGRAGKAEFTDEFVSSQRCQDMQRRVTTHFDQTIEDMGWERIRSRIVLKTRDGRRMERWADEAYRGSPMNAIDDRQLEGKFRDCASGLLDDVRCDALFERVWAIETLPDASVLIDALQWRGVS